MPLTRLTIDFKDSCKAATTGNLTLTGGAPNVLDGVTLALNDSILVKDQNNLAENGIYRITTLGTGSNGTWTRRSDFNDSRQITPGSLLFTELGTNNGNTFYYIRGGLDTTTFTVGTTTLAFSNLSSTFGTGGAGYGNAQVAQYLPTFTGNVTAGNVITLSGGQHIGYHTGAIGANTANTGAFTTVSVSSATTAISNSGTSGVGNIGATGATFNTVFAKATTAQYADVAEKYTADCNLSPGDVVVFGGTSEITTTTISHDNRIAGVISTNPAYLMNSESNGYPVALLGRVPCRVLGPVDKGQSVVSSDISGVAQALDKLKYTPGCVIGKSLEVISTNEIHTIEIVVGRL